MPSTNPGTPDGPVYYFATQAGTYTNFGALVLDGSYYILDWNGTAWSSTKIDLPTTAETEAYINSLISPFQGAISELESNTNAINSVVFTKSPVVTPFQQTEKHLYIANGKFSTATQQFTIGYHVAESDEIVYLHIVQPSFSVELGSVAKVSSVSDIAAGNSLEYIHKNPANTAYDTEFKVSLSAGEVLCFSYRSDINSAELHLSEGLNTIVSTVSDAVRALSSAINDLGNDVEGVDERVEDIKEKLFQSRSVEIEYLYTDRFVYKTGSVNQLSGYYLTEDITLQDGEKIAVKASGYLGNVAIISKHSGSSYIPLVLSVDSTYRDYEYTNLSGSAITVAISGRSSSSSAPVASISTDALDNFSTRITNLEGQIGEIVPNKLTLSLFEKIGVIGDSYASAALSPDGGTSWVFPYNKSWPQILARKVGATAHNFTKGGLTTETWLSSEKGLSLLNSTEPCEMYICALSINDVARGGSAYLGTLADITDYQSSEDYANSFYGNYGRIIEAIKAKSPNAVIFIAKGIGTSGLWGQYRDAVQELGTHYNICIIDQMEAPYANSLIYRDMVGGHPTALGYAEMAVGFEKLVNDYMEANSTYFKLLFTAE